MDRVCHKPNTPTLKARATEEQRIHRLAAKTRKDKDNLASDVVFDEIVRRVRFCAEELRIMQIMKALMI